MFKIAPLPSSFMLLSLFGFIISAFFISNPLVKDWAWAFMILFIFMFAGSMISLSNTPLETEHIENLSIHKKGHYSKNKK